METLQHLNIHGNIHVLIVYGKNCFWNVAKSVATNSFLCASIHILTRFWKSSELVCKSKYQPFFIEMQRLSEINHNFILKNRKISHVGGLFENLSVKSFKPKGIFTNWYGKNFLTKYFSNFKTKSIYGLRCTNLLQTERNL